MTDNIFYEDLITKFNEVYSKPPTLVSRAAGRVELIGGHTDYNEGFVIAAAIDKSCFIAAAPRDDNQIYLYSAWAEQNNTFEISPDIKPSPDCQWSNYARGVSALLIAQGIELNGVNIYITSNVPLGAGLSSSAALEVSIANALIEIANQDTKISRLQLAKICQKAENDFANSPCGIMDQIVSINGTNNNAIFLDCRTLKISPLPFDDSSCCIMIFNSMVTHEIGGGDYGQRRSQCQQALETIKNHHPDIRALRDVTPQILESVKNELSHLLFNRACHIVNENLRVKKAAKALKNNDMKLFGQLISQSHASARDLYQISCDETDFLADSICDCSGVYGARICGGGFGGSVIAIVRTCEAEKITRSVQNAYRQKFNIGCEVHITSPSLGTEIIFL